MACGMKHKGKAKKYGSGGAVYKKKKKKSKK
jgi:hypothetical protein